MLLNLDMQLKTGNHTQYWPRHSPNRTRRIGNELIKSLQEEITEEINKTIIDRLKQIPEL